MTSPGLRKTIALAEPILRGLGFGGDRVATIETDDPDALGEALRAIGAARARAAARELHAGRRQARRAAAGAARTAARGARAGRHRAAARRRAVRHGRAQRRGLHAVPRLRVGLPDRRAARRTPSGRCCASPRMPACSAGCARRPARRRSSRSSPQLDFRAATAAARVLKEEEPFECIRCGKPFGVKKHDRARRGQARRQALDVQGLGAAARSHQDVRGLPRGGDGGAGFRSLRRAAAAARAPPKTICASASEKQRGGES